MNRGRMECTEPRRWPQPMLGLACSEGSCGIGSMTSLVVVVVVVLAAQSLPRISFWSRLAPQIHTRQ